MKTKSSASELADQVTTAIQGWVKRTFDSRQAETVSLMTDLEARVAAIESARTMSFCGAHDPGIAYEAGAVVQRQNALYVALVPTAEMPGQSMAWRRIATSAAAS